MAQKAEGRRFIKIHTLREIKNAEIYKAELQTKQGLRIASAKEFQHSNRKKQKTEYDKERGILQKLQHENVCEYIDAFVVTMTDDEQPSYFIFTEYSSKGSVFDLLRNSDVRNEDKRNWMIQAAKAVKYIHSQKIVHKDIRSRNFLVTKDNVLKLGDFGRAKDPDDTTTSTTTTTCNEEGAYAWKAPEVLQSKKSLIPSSADIYSMSTFFWELITEQIPFKGMARGEVVEAVVVDRKHPPIKKLWSVRIAYLLNKCWAATEKDRPNAEEILRKFLSGISVDGK